MAYWAQQESEPKRQFRWILTLGDIPAYTLKKVNKPSLTVKEAQHAFLNHTYYYPGRVEWNTIDMTLADPQDPDVSAAFAVMLRQAGYRPKISGSVSAEDLTTMSKSSATQILSTGGGVRIKQLNSAGETVEQWRLVNPFITEVNFGELSYESDDLVEISVKMRYDYAILNEEVDSPGQLPEGIEGTFPVWGEQDTGSTTT